MVISYAYRNPNLVAQNNRPYLVHTCITTGKSLGYYGSTGKSAFFLCLVLPCRGVPISVILTLGGVSSFFSKKQKIDDL